MKSKLFLYVSLGVDLSIAISKFIAAAFTGSSSMVSEGIHSVIDAISQLMLIWGVKTSRRVADADRPFGYGKELYFWSFIVSLVIFILGGCISFYEGWVRFSKPQFEGSPTWNYVVLAIAFAFNLVSMVTALKAFNVQRGRITFWNALVRTKDPSTIIVLLGDFGDLIGLFIAFLGVFLGRLLHNPYYDGIASMLIGVVLIVISAFLVRESKSLLMGEPTGKRILRKVIAMVQADEAVVKVKKHFSTYMSPEDVLLQLNTVFKQGLTTKQITDAIERITKNIQTEFPRMKQVFIEPVAN
ncbi:cation diffusion facilitator family transporter [Mucilaginibacter sp. E4BP6]|uniref:cation diffusion facilitator family transporter n=1 Tax=Mucilaginibacter sp. E4BP6 TaxID=2723089 RepID=UPI0015CCFF5C|nr:cation diffusion facilitator family transporter [Mucilaginibacter sp. E4BP6]NYE65704.1 cation diffusion facilitator family transporter [Mucilaginibacter sp. E4BP6]